jgi:hypothetical protein
MSYTEYLRRKAATSQTVIDYQPRKVDASQFVTQQRLAASRIFALSNNRKGVVTNVNDPSSTGTASSLKSVTPTTKVSGGRIPDASSYTAYIGSEAIGKDLKGGARTTKYVLQANLPASLCNNTFLNGPTAPKSAGDWVRSQAECCGEAHNQNELGPALFVDDTIRLKNLGGCCENEISKAVHSHPADVPHNTGYQARPTKSKIPVFTVPSPDDARKVGGYDYKDRQKYVERHHGNDLNVNPRRVPTKFQIPQNSPAQLKINDPTQAPKL